MEVCELHHKESVVVFGSLKAKFQCKSGWSAILKTDLDFPHKVSVTANILTASRERDKMAAMEVQTGPLHRGVELRAVVYMRTDNQSHSFEVWRQTPRKPESNEEIVAYLKIWDCQDKSMCNIL
ncbi:hypothetical protein RRG08_027332 [Elysia crispata]|uniref:Uncharacterized protein n=1 Tax=Elysia crispata TaxID=231223 RepID=A0AAE0ZPD9_9GAST|nr:hypothetical protein RRG08_027332 [Elysia crispata]